MGLDSIVSIMAALFAIITGALLLWALGLGLKQLGGYFRTAFRGKDILTRDEAASLRDEIEATRMLIKSAKAADRELEVNKK